MCAVCKLQMCALLNNNEIFARRKNNRAVYNGIPIWNTKILRKFPTHVQTLMLRFTVTQIETLVLDWKREAELTINICFYCFYKNDGTCQISVLNRLWK